MNIQDQVSYGQNGAQISGTGVPAPIQDSGQSPQAMFLNKRQISPTDKQQSPNQDPAALDDQKQPFRNHQVNYSFGQQPFKEIQKSQRFGASSGQNSMRQAVNQANGGSDTQRNKSNSPNPQNYGGAHGNPMRTSDINSASDSAANSKGQKSAVSMASVMGTFDNVTVGNQEPNIFAQSINKQKKESPSPQPATALHKSKKPPTGPAQMTSTQKNFSTTAKKVTEMEQLVSNGLAMNEHRASQHSLEAEKMGLRKSQEGIYQDVTQPAQDPALKGRSNSFVQKLAAKAAANVDQTVQQTVAGAVPEQVKQQMIQRGFRPSSKQDGQFEYDSDTVEHYEMISNEFDYEEVRKGNDFGIKQYKDCIYRGQLNVARQREGLGVLVYQNGRIYEGEWLKNKRHGRGYEVFSNGNSYHGTYENGKANGKGVYQWKNGEVYDGEWMQGIKHGYGVWKGTNGESYIGQWVQSKAQGYGVHVFANGDKYEGEWLQCLREGNGSDFFANGDCYVGQYAQGKPEGFGQYKWKNGSSYTGQFKNGLKHGHGKWKKKQADEYGQTKCNSYEGMYQADKKHGYGVFEWESGNRYQGDYQEDERHGYGVMRWTDESCYMGLWEQGIQHGVGVMIFPDGVKRAGIFEENVFKESLKRKDQIDPYRDLLKDDCLQLLEDILAQRVQSKANLFGPLNKDKAELMQKDFNNGDLSVANDSQSQLGRNTSEGRVPSQNNAGSNAVMANDFVSDNASVMNQPFRDADKEDLTQTMQKGNPMRDSMGKSAKKEISQDKLPPLPATATPKHVGRTIEVQTDLSMVTMEQYSQGYNSKAFMNKTTDFRNSGENSKQDNNRQGSPNIKYQNDLQIQQQAASLNQSNKDWQNVLQKPQFQDEKLQQEILGGGNPNEDTESEWNRNNSSMMVRKPNLFNNTTKSSKNPNHEMQNNLVSRGKRRMLVNNKNTSVNIARRQRSNDNSHSRGRANQQNNFASPYASHNRMDQHRPQQMQGGLNMPPRANKFVDRSTMQNRHGQRQERSLPPALPQHKTIPVGNGDFVIPGPQLNKPQNNRAVNRHNVMNLLNTDNAKRPPQKMFQSQYGNARFGQPQLPPPPPQIFSQNESIMQQYPLIDSPDVQKRSYTIPMSEQHPSMNVSRIDSIHGQGVLPQIGNQMQQRPQNHSKHDTPVVHQNVKRNYPNSLPRGVHTNPLSQYAGGFNPLQESRREDILTPSPKMIRQSKNSSYPAFNPEFNRSMGQGQFQFNIGQTEIGDPRSGTMNEMAISDHSQIAAAEPMFGNEYAGYDARSGQQYAAGQSQINDRRNSSFLPSESNGFVDPGVRGITTTSSQRTLRYNDFELIQKQVQNEKEFEVHLDEGDDKDSARESSAERRAKNNNSVAYPDIKMQRLYESKERMPKVQSNKLPPFQQSSSQAFGNSRQSLPKMGLNQSIKQQQRGQSMRQHLNSNDTQLASHTINLNASQENSQREENGRILLPNQRLVQQSLPPPGHHHSHNPSKISVKQGISIMNPSDVRMGRVMPGQQRTHATSNSPKAPNNGANYKFVGQKANNKRSIGNVRENRDGSNSNSKGRFDFVGPYAQNLKKPKLYEARGTQKIALKNHLASLQQKMGASLMQKQVQGTGQFNSEVFSKKKSYFGGNGLHDEHVDDRGDKHTNRFGSHGPQEYEGGNFVIQHNSLQAAQQEAAMHHEQNLPHKRVWVPYNKKLKLKGMQKNMLQTSNGHMLPRHGAQSNGSGNPLLNSN